MFRTHVCLAVVIALYFTDIEAQTYENPCKQAETCGECISANGLCGWCDDWEYHELHLYKQCDYVQTLMAQGCPIARIVDPNSYVAIIQAKALSDARSSLYRAVQVSPQRVRVRLRVEKSAYLHVKVRQALDYPVDLYYVMDLSKSMRDDLENLKILGDQLAREMKKLTKNFRLGFGSFVDKVVMPYANTVPRKLKEPCDDCIAPFGFRNSLPLHNDSSRFTAKIHQQRTSGNLDHPEGGMDALMQATVCKDKIGWRDGARHLIIYTTDANFHYAGDGKLAGIVRPNDGECYLDSETGEYTKSAFLDYPSISQLNKKMVEHNVIPVFAVTQTEVHIYKELTSHIAGSTAGILATDSSNIVELVKENYKKITSRVTLVDDAPRGIKLSYDSTCKKNVTNFGSNECTGLDVGDTVSFQVRITATECLDKTQTFHIRPIGFDESVEVIAEVDCDCDCEAKAIAEAEACHHGNGTLSCSACICNDFRYGSNCQCSRDDDGPEDLSVCILGNTTGTQGLVCSGRGRCLCGECVCGPGPRDQIFSGPFCECDDTSCDRSGGLVCGGPSRGECICDEILHKSVCRCRDGWIGAACDCPATNIACIASTGEECNGVGYCDCGLCKCNSSISLYFGPTCEDCPIEKAKEGVCEVNRCKNSKACVQCKAYESGNLTREECDECPYPVIMVEEIERENIEVCRYQDDDDCIFEFIHWQLENGSHVLYVDEDKVCPVAVNPLFIVLGVILGILFIGLALLLIWKILTTIHDRREFAKFEQEKMEAKWDAEENPIYKHATSTFKNPTYTGSLFASGAGGDGFVGGAGGGGSGKIGLSSAGGGSAGYGGAGGYGGSGGYGGGGGGGGGGTVSRSYAYSSSTMADGYGGGGGIMVDGSYGGGTVGRGYGGGSVGDGYSSTTVTHNYGGGEGGRGGGGGSVGESYSYNTVSSSYGGGGMSPGQGGGTLTRSPGGGTLIRSAGGGSVGHGGGTLSRGQGGGTLSRSHGTGTLGRTYAPGTVGESYMHTMSGHGGADGTGCAECAAAAAGTGGGQPYSQTTTYTFNDGNTTYTQYSTNYVQHFD